MTTSQEPRDVYVNEYDRTRNGRAEHVRDHWRSRPHG